MKFLIYIFVIKFSFKIAKIHESKHTRVVCLLSLAYYEHFAAQKGDYYQMWIFSDFEGQFDDKNIY